MTAGVVVGYHIVFFPELAFLRLRRRTTCPSKVRWGFIKGHSSFSDARLVSRLMEKSISMVKVKDIHESGSFYYAVELSLRILAYSYTW